jgi:N-acetylglutamate synthase-like GNAT family acetyltransferase
MIGIRAVLSQNLKSVEEFINNNCCQIVSLCSQEVLVMVEEDEIIGASVMYLNEGQAVLEALVISKTRRGEYLGDGLLRASLNYILKKGVNHCTYDKAEKREFFLRMGFAPSKEGKKGSSNPLVVDIESFFTKSCKSKG